MLIININRSTGIQRVCFVPYTPLSLF